MKYKKIAIAFLLLVYLSVSADYIGDMLNASSDVSLYSGVAWAIINVLIFFKTIKFLFK